jgi:hypothetical protein
VFASPTTCPAELIAFASLFTPPREPRSIRVPLVPFAVEGFQRKAWGAPVFR